MSSQRKWEYPKVFVQLWTSFNLQPSTNRFADLALDPWSVTLCLLKTCIFQMQTCKFWWCLRKQQYPEAFFTLQECVNFWKSIAWILCDNSGNGSWPWPWPNIFGTLFIEWANGLLHGQYCFQWHIKGNKSIWKLSVYTIMPFTYYEYVYLIYACWPWQWPLIINTLYIERLTPSY